jgi:hypothetical protein
MRTLKIYDPALCCSTGICGPEVDERLVRFAADVEWLRSRGASVERFNLGQDPGAFAAAGTVRDALVARGVAVLPLLVADDAIVSEGTYPDRAALARFVGFATDEPVSGRGALPIQACAPGSGCC